MTAYRNNLPQSRIFCIPIIFLFVWNCFFSSISHWMPQDRNLCAILALWCVIAIMNISNYFMYTFFFFLVHLLRNIFETWNLGSFLWFSPCVPKNAPYRNIHPSNIFWSPRCYTHGMHFPRIYMCSYTYSHFSAADNRSWKLEIHCYMWPLPS